MKVGLIARSEERGLGIQTKAFHDWVKPARTLVVVPTVLPSNATHEQHLDWYPDGTVVEWAGRDLDENAVREWLYGLDVVFSAETFYDWRIVEWAADMGVATVCQVNPEFYRHAVDPTLPHPTVWWAPTTWRLDTLPDGTRVVPVPVDERRREAKQPASGRLKLLHVVGRVAANDRNGTAEIVRAVGRAQKPVDLTVYVQSGRVELPHRLPPNVTIDVRRGSLADRWAMYEGHHMLVMPRRYGGLCLPAQEAAACGLGVAMTDVSPNNTFYPIVPIKVTDPGRIRVPCGDILLHNPHRQLFRSTLASWSEDRTIVADAQQRATLWARAHSWPSTRAQYMIELEEAAALAGGTPSA